MLTREKALSLVKENIINKKIIAHCLAVEAIMKGLAKHLKQDEATWGLVGLIHDLDYEQTKASPEKHTLVAAEMLKNLLPNGIIRTIEAHNAKYTKVFPKTQMEKALIAADAISGLLVACALVMPTKRLEEVTLKTVKHKFKSKDFARNVDRERISLCEAIGIPREEFFAISLQSLQSISKELEKLI
jgi:putative nucleotidyltransferase with HDIG domain